MQWPGIMYFFSRKLDALFEWLGRPGRDMFGFRSLPWRSPLNSHSYKETMEFINMNRTRVETRALARGYLPIIFRQREFQLDRMMWTGKRSSSDIDQIVEFFHSRPKTGP